MRLCVPYQEECIVTVILRDDFVFLLSTYAMDDNLRQSPQLPPRKLPTLKLTPAEEESNSIQRLSSDNHSLLQPKS